MSANESILCPVCGGNGLVPNGFYNQYSGDWITSSVIPEMCRSCNGTGIVWEPEETTEFECTNKTDDGNK